MKAIEDIIKENDIIVLEKSIDDCKGCYIKYKDLDIITIDPTLSEAEKVEVLKHELGHFMAKATYSINEKDENKIMIAEKIADDEARKIFKS